MASNVDIVALGEPLYEFSEMPEQPGTYRQGFGGDTMNAAIAAARQGCKVAYITRLGDDEFGRQFFKLWRDENMDVSGVAIDRDAHTGVYFIHYGAQGHVFSYLRAGSAASRMRPDDLPIDLIRSARFFHTSAISQAISASACDAVFAAVGTAKAAGVSITYDSNLRLRLWPLPRAKAVIEATVGLADYFLPSFDDVKAISGLDNPEAIVDWSHALGARYVALKLGAQGVIASDGHSRQRISAHAVDCVDATGAGDCFAGCLLASLVKGKDFWTAVRYANAAAALTTTGYGAVAPLPRPAEVTALLGRQ